MAPIQSESDSESDVRDLSGSRQDGAVHAGQPTLNGQLVGTEEEFHTEDSDASDDEGAALPDEVEEHHGDGDVESGASGVPLLPESLLKQLSKPAQTAPSLSDLPWDQLTSKQKKARRTNSRKMKKRQYDRLKEDTDGTGVLEAGKAAQKKRGIVPAKKDRVVSGRVGKKNAKSREKVLVSGRQQMIESRKKMVEQAAGGMERPVRRAKTKSKR